MKGTGPEQELLLALLSHALFEREIRLPEDADWNALFREARQQAVLPLVFESVKEQLPPSVRDALQDWVEEALVNNLLVDYEHVELHETMSGAGIGYVVMKGSASAAYYPKPMLRMMGDVDFLVHAEDAERGGELLRSLGFRETAERDNPIHQAYVRRGEDGRCSEWELHWLPNGIPRNETGERIRELLADSVETACLHETDNGAYLVPDDFHHGLMILIHTAMHLMHSGVGLRHLCDWAVFASHFSGDAFRALFEEKLREVGLWDFAAALTAISVRYLGCPDARWQGDLPESLTQGLLLDILRGGNFGKKDRERLNEAKLLVNRREGTVRRGAWLRNAASAMNEKSRRLMPSCRKNPLLLPIGWLRVGLRQIGRILRGRSPGLHLKSMVEGAAERSALYEQLRIYENAGDE